jgi:D-sedoheptulose 7-phosphate isomerase
MSEIQSGIRNYVDRVRHVLDTLDHDAIERVVGILIDAHEQNRTVFICGNGGSASTASHMAADLGKNTAVPGKSRLRVMSLTDNMSWFSALGNDLGYENVFVEQIANLLKPGDVLITISASGNSPNVVKAAEFTLAGGGTVVALVGFEGGRLKEIADVAIHTRSGDYGPVEDSHLMLDHIFVEALCRHIHSK